MDRDAQTIERVRRGDVDAFDELVGRYQREIYFLVLRMVKNEQDAEEVAQQAFINAFNSLKKFRGGSTFKTWLYRIAINLANTHLKRNKRRGQLVEEMTAEPEETARSPLDRLLDTEAAHEAVRALDTLGEKQKMTVILRIFQELPYEEIGHIVGCSAQTAKVHFHYGIENLRKRLKDQ